MLVTESFSGKLGAGGNCRRAAYMLCRVDVVGDGNYWKCQYSAGRETTKVARYKEAAVARQQ